MGCQVPPLHQRVRTVLFGLFRRWLYVLDISLMRLSLALQLLRSQDKLCPMKSHLLGLMTLGFCTCFACAQTAPSPLPATPPTTVVPVPFDGKSQAQLDFHSKHTYQLRLKYVKPSVMAFWLDPKNHEVPPELQQVIPGTSNLKQGDVLVVPSPLSSRFRLPAGVDRVVAVDPQNALLVFGTPEGLAQLRMMVAFLDRPTRSVEFDCTAFWLDALSPEAAKWRGGVLQLQGVGADAGAELDSLVQGDRAARFPLLVVQNGASSTSMATLPFAVQEPGRNPRRAFPGLNGGGEFDYQMPNIRGGVEIDPDMVMPHLGTLSFPSRTTLRLSPVQNGEDALTINVGIGGQTLFASAGEGQTFLLYGSASAFGLTPPSPRFGTLVVRITPHVIQSTTPLNPLTP